MDGSRRQVSIRRPMSQSNSRAMTSNDDVHNFYFDSVYDWKLVNPTINVLLIDDFLVDF